MHGNGFSLAERTELAADWSALIHGEHAGRYVVISAMRKYLATLNRSPGEATPFIAVTTRHAWSDAAGRDFSGRHIAG
jgi:hypothetical protein